jgi:uncharacterized iron-regulated protein
MSLALNLLAAAALAQAAPPASPPPLPAQPPATPCLKAGEWRDGHGQPLPAASALARAALARIVLLGEAHATPGIHAWQAATAATLARDGRPLVIAVEWLPSRVQAALDRFVAGTIDEAQFLAESDWKTLWRHDFAAYRPVFVLAREQRIPIRALNIDRAIVRTTSREGIEAGLAAARAAGTPVGRPAPPTAAYRARLEASFAEHGKPGDPPPRPEMITRFMAAQGMWDRAMAEGIAAILAEQPAARVIGMMGLGHMEGGDGVSHQLAALGHRGVFSAIPGIANPEKGGACDPGPNPAHLIAGW